MSPELQVALIAAIGGPILGLIGIILNVRSTRRNAEKTNQAAIANAEAAAKNATTSEFKVLSESYEGAFARQDRELKALRENEEKRDAFEQEVLEFVEVLVDHLDILEELVPNPPGAPPRPPFPAAMRRRLRGRGA